MEKKILFLLIGVILPLVSIYAQVTYPSPAIDNTTISNGTLNYIFNLPIAAPTNPSSGNAVTINGTANVQMLSGTEVTLSDGFTASASNASFSYRAAIQSNPEMVVISPDATHIINNVVHVNKWEKFEIGVNLPQDYLDCVNSYRDHRILSTGAVDIIHDLNPYADDSLILTMQLTSPSGRQITKYGFFARMGGWSSADGDFLLTDNNNDPLSPYNVRFRFAPDEESSIPWQFTISISAPYTHNLSTSELLPALTMTGNTFICDLALADNHGYLSVNQNNKRYLVFDDGTTFFGMGHDMAEVQHYWNYTNSALNLNFMRFYKFDLADWTQSFLDLKDASANYARIFMNQENFAFEYEHLGWYDEYHDRPTFCPVSNDAWQGHESGNRQWNLWAFDQVMDEARQDGIYLQLNVDQAPWVGDQVELWGGNCYVYKYVYPTGSQFGQAPFTHVEYYWDGFDSNDPNDAGSLYYWKRHYKYLMARYGYSVNIGMLEFNNEYDQVLGFRNSNAQANCGSSVSYSERSDIMNAINSYIDNIVGYTKNTLGESNHLFTCSFGNPGLAKYYGPISEGGTGYTNYSASQYYSIFQNPNIDIADIHFADGSLYSDWPQTDADKKPNVGRWNISNDVHGNGSNPAYQLNIDKPFHFGEGDNYQLATPVSDPNGYPDRNEPACHLFDNYDVSFHNNIWATAFMNNCTASMMWQGALVQWWQYCNPRPHDDGNNINLTPGSHFSNLLGDINTIYTWSGNNHISVPIENKKIHMNFKPLSDYFFSPTTGSRIDLNDRFTNHYYYDETNNIEIYYMVNSDKTAAYGWVHNLNKYYNNHYYTLAEPSSSITHSTDRYYYCDDFTSSPAPGFYLPALQDDYPRFYYAQFYPTRQNQNLPDDQYINDETILYVPLVNNTLGCSDLDADYAFKVAVEGSGHRMSPSKEQEKVEKELSGFSVYPNPSSGHFTIAIPLNNRETNYDLYIYNVAGQVAFEKKDTKENIYNIDLSNQSRGIYYVKVILNDKVMFKKIIVQ